MDPGGPCGGGERCEESGGMELGSYLPRDVVMSGNSLGPSRDGL